jgi:hypothetical protein
MAQHFEADRWHPADDMMIHEVVMVC